MKWSRRLLGRALLTAGKFGFTSTEEFDLNSSVFSSVYATEDLVVELHID